MTGATDVLLLTVLADGPLHGYAIVERLRRLAGATIGRADGALYAGLHRLEVAGLLHSGWVDAGDRRRRIYTLTDAGRRSLTDPHSSRIFGRAVAPARATTGRAWPSRA